MKVNDSSLIDCYTRLPSHTARNIRELVESANLESRNALWREIDRFMTDISTAIQPFVFFIIGEWGEGKTTAFEGYLKFESEKANIQSTLISARTLFNCLKKIKEKEILESNVTSAILVAAILWAIVDEEKARGTKSYNIPDPRSLSIRDAVDYVYNALDCLFSSMKPSNKRLVVFIDEFEEILTIREEEIKDLIISGIVEFIEGKLGIISEKGKYAGMFHLVVSVTPAAYHMLGKDKRLTQLIGRFKRRIYRYQLKSITKEEAYRYIIAAIKYSFNRKQFDIPFSSPGIINTCYFITKGNLGALTQLFNILLTQSRSESPYKCKMYRIDYKRFLKYVKGKTIFVYGDEAKIIDEKFFNMLRMLEEELRNYPNIRRNNLINIFDIIWLLSVEYEPKSKLEIMRKLGLQEVDDVDTCVNILNGLFRARKRKMGKTIYEVYYVPWYSGIEEDLRKLFSEMSAILNLKLDDETIEKIIDLLTFYEISDDRLIPYLIWPAQETDSYYLVELTEGLIQEEEAIEIRRQFIKYVKDEGIRRDKMLIISHEILKNLYPAPEITYLDFIIDRNDRMRLWREARRELINNLLPEEKYINALSKLFENQSPLYGLKYGSEVFYLLEHSTGDVKYEIPTLIRVFVRPPDEEEINKFVKFLKNFMPPLTLIFHAHGFQKVQETIKITCGKVLELCTLQFVLLSQTTLLQLISYLKAIEEEKNSSHKRLLDEDKLKIRFKEIFEELEFPKIISEIIRDGIDKGWIIRDLDLQSTSDPSNLVDAFICFLSYPKRKMTIGDVWNFYKQLNELKIFGTKPGFSPRDIESYQQFYNYAQDLIKNGFLKIDGQYVEPVLTKIEERILKIIDNYDSSPIPISELKERFVTIAKTSNLFKDVFLNALEKRGIIEIRKNLLFKADIAERQEKLQRLYNTFKARIEKLKEEKIINVFRFVVSTKERGCNVIDPFEIEKFVDKIYHKVEYAQLSDENLFLRLATFLINFLNYHLNERIGIFTLINKAYNEALKERALFKQEIDNVKKKIHKIVVFLSSISHVPIEQIQLDELTTLKEIHYDVESVFSKSPGKSEVKDAVSKDSEAYKKFWIKRVKELRSSPIEYDFLNYGYYQLIKKKEKSKQLLLKIKDLISRIEEKERNIGERFNKLQEYLIRIEKMKSVDNENEFLGPSFSGELAQLLEKNIKSPTFYFKDIKNLTDVKSFLDNFLKEMIDIFENIRISVESLSNLQQSEFLIKKLYDFQAKKYNLSKKFLENSSYSQQLIELWTQFEKSISDQLKALKDEYEKELRIIKKTYIGSAVVSRIQELAKKISDKLISLKEKIQTNTKKILSLVKESIDELEKLYKRADQLYFAIEAVVGDSSKKKEAEYLHDEITVVSKEWKQLEKIFVAENSDSAEIIEFKKFLDMKSLLFSSLQKLEEILLTSGRLDNLDLKIFEITKEISEKEQTNIPISSIISYILNNVNQKLTENEILFKLYKLSNYGLIQINVVA